MKDVVLALVPVVVLVAAWILYIRYNSDGPDQPEEDERQ